MIVALVSDLIFESKIAATAAAAGVAVRIVRTVAATVPLEAEARAVFVDLNLPTGDALDYVRAAKLRFPALPLVSFLSHVQVELARDARAAGADEVLPRSRFSADLAKILQRYAGDAGPGRPDPPPALP